MPRHTRRLLAIALTAAVLVGCGSDDDGGTTATTSEAADLTTTTEGADTIPSVTVNLIHDFVPGDHSGITRDNNEEGSPCGTTNLTTPDETLAFMTPGAEVLVRSGGEILAEEMLDVGSATNIQPDNSYTCTWSVAFNALPVSDFYEVEVDGEKVGTLQRAEVEDAGPSGVDLALSP